MASRDLNMLTPTLKPKAEEWLIRCAKANILVLITCTARLVKEQLALYSQGRDDLAHVNYLRARAGMAPITAQQNTRRVTWTLKSKHLIDLDDGDPGNDKARAFDFCILKPDQKPTWDLKVDVDSDDVPDYLEAGQIAESLGLKWGGRWKKNPDYPHIEEV